MTNTETFTFSQTDELGVTTTVSYTVPSVGTTCDTFLDMCGKAAVAFGYQQDSVDKIMNGEGQYEPFEEYYKD